MHTPDSRRGINSQGRAPPETLARTEGSLGKQIALLRVQDLPVTGREAAPGHQPRLLTADSAEIQSSSGFIFSSAQELQISDRRAAPGHLATLISADSAEFSSLLGSEVAQTVTRLQGSKRRRVLPDVQDLPVSGREAAPGHQPRLLTADSAEIQSSSGFIFSSAQELQISDRRAAPGHLSTLISADSAEFSSLEIAQTEPRLQGSKRRRVIPDRITWPIPTSAEDRTPKSERGSKRKGIPRRLPIHMQRGRVTFSVYSGSAQLEREQPEAAEGVEACGRKRVRGESPPCSRTRSRIKGGRELGSISLDICKEGIPPRVSLFSSLPGTSIALPPPHPAPPRDRLTRPDTSDDALQLETSPNIELLSAAGSGVGDSRSGGGRDAVEGGCTGGTSGLGSSDLLQHLLGKSSLESAQEGDPTSTIGPGLADGEVLTHSLSPWSDTTPHPLACHALFLPPNLEWNNTAQSGSALEDPMGSAQDLETQQHILSHTISLIDDDSTVGTPPVPSSARGPFRIPHTLLRQLLRDRQAWWTGTTVEYALQMLCDARQGWDLLDGTQWDGTCLNMSDDQLIRKLQRKLLAHPSTVLWPCNLTNNHWVLLIIEPNVPQMFYYDSFWTFPFQLLLCLHSIITKALNRSHSQEPILMNPIYNPHQEDGHSCGPCVVLAAQGHGQALAVSRTALYQYRQHVLEAILHDESPVVALEVNSGDPFPLPPGVAPIGVASPRPRLSRRCATRLTVPTVARLPCAHPVLIPQWPGRHVFVAPSSLPDAGLGLFTARDIILGKSRRANIICKYEGLQLTPEVAHSDAYYSDYIWENANGTLVIDAADPLSCFGRYVNDHFEEDKCNCEIREIEGSAFVIALMDIPAGELFLSYGRSYWEVKVHKLPPGPCREACCRRYALDSPHLSPPSPAVLAGPPLDLEPHSPMQAFSAQILSPERPEILATHLPLPPCIQQTSNSAPTLNSTLCPPCWTPQSRRIQTCRPDKRTLSRPLGKRAAWTGREKIFSRTHGWGTVIYITCSTI